LKANVTESFIPAQKSIKVKFLLILAKDVDIRNRAFFLILDLCLNYVFDLYFANFYLGEFKKEREGLNVSQGECGRGGSVTPSFLTSFCPLQNGVDTTDTTSRHLYFSEGERIRKNLV
jgi:hypothetical protein